ncbi:MAG TPA: ferrous iron transport protein B [Longimicrobiales bacterium]|nr:ferrous iron transport protein B [Longimicrobiales bacterium]
MRLALVGNPNVGKSVLFNRLTGAYVVVSNYPGTSVAVTRGHGHLGDREVEVVDTPGAYALVPGTEEERVTQQHILDGSADVLIHVVDAKNLPRGLPFTLQLLDCGRPVVLVLNMMDELDELGVSVRADTLRERLGIPVVPMVAVRGEGLDELAAAVEEVLNTPPPPPPDYPNGVGLAIRTVRDALLGTYGVDRMALASLFLQRDEGAQLLVRATEPDGGDAASAAVDDVAGSLGGPAVYRVAFERQHVARDILEDVMWQNREPTERFGERFGRWLANPLTGIPILLAVLWIGLYEFVGVFGAGTLVDLIEGPLFGERFNPFMERIFLGIPWEWLRGLFVGEYGMITLGLRYAVAIILPVVGSFFLFFSVLEDSGYFPRLALLVDRSFKRIGLSGRAVIPIVLGFACDTMATMVTRTLETKRERVLSTLLLALAIPCSAQLGVILAILSGQPKALLVWFLSLIATFVLVGWLSAKLLPGEKASFHMELPPMRVPRVGNVLLKTYSRMQWYFLEVLPLFLLASVMLWALDITGLIKWVIAGLTPVVGMIGLPPETATVFLFGFFRRDYGAAGLFDLNQAGVLDVVNLTVAAVTLTLFVPCIAQFLMMIRERGWRTAVGMFALITPFAFGAGLFLNIFLRGIGW